MQPPEGGVDLSRTPTRGELQRARNIRLQALGAIRALEPEQDAVLVSGFLSAFGETNASIARLERAIGAGNRQVAHALRSLRVDVRDERELATRAGSPAVGALRSVSGTVEAWSQVPRQTYWLTEERAPEQAKDLVDL
jgi:hypothetical protein